MNKMDALGLWWVDPAVVIIPAGETTRIIDWLAQQTPDTWHQIVMNWNYDYGYEVLAWILEQDNCDKGTAARIFLVEGVGHWLWDALGDTGSIGDEHHLCRVVLRNWHRYRAGELRPKYMVPDAALELLRKSESHPLLTNTPILEIMNFEGVRDAFSKYDSEDGKVVVSLDHWAKENGIEIDERPNFNR